jgi:hypothetical protein
MDGQAMGGAPELIVDNQTVSAAQSSAARIRHGDCRMPPQESPLTLSNSTSECWSIAIFLKRKSHK